MDRHLHIELPISKDYPNGGFLRVNRHTGTEEIIPYACNRELTVRVRQNHPINPPRTIRVSHHD